MAAVRSVRDVGGRAGRQRASLKQSARGANLHYARFSAAAAFRKNQMTDLVGVGLYDRREAGRLTGAKPATIGRWLSGYDRGGRHYEPLWEPRVAADDELVLDFRDLMELRAVISFVNSKISVRTMRKAILVAAERVGTDRPLSTLRFKTDGARIFFEDLEVDEGETPLEDLFSGQRQMREVIERTLQDVDFSDDIPCLWWPLGRRAGVVIDPTRSFGQPIETETAIPTHTLAIAAEVEGGIEEAARLYEVSTRAVRRAVHFQNEFAQAA